MARVALRKFLKVLRPLPVIFGYIQCTVYKAALTT